MEHKERERLIQAKTILLNRLGLNYESLSISKEGKSKIKELVKKYKSMYTEIIKDLKKGGDI